MPMSSWSVLPLLWWGHGHLSKYRSQLSYEGGASFLVAVLNERKGQ